MKASVKSLGNLRQGSVMGINKRGINKRGINKRGIWARPIRSLLHDPDMPDWDAVASNSSGNAIL